MCAGCAQAVLMNLILTDHYYGMPTADHNTHEQGGVGSASCPLRWVMQSQAVPQAAKQSYHNSKSFSHLIIPSKFITRVNTEGLEPLMRLGVDEGIILKLSLTRLCTIRAVIFKLCLYDGTPSPPSLEKIFSCPFLNFVLTKNGFFFHPSFSLLKSTHFMFISAIINEDFTNARN
jgi:hypothetical protein